MSFAFRSITEDNISFQPSVPYGSEASESISDLHDNMNEFPIPNTVSHTLSSKSHDNQPNEPDSQKTSQNLHGDPLKPINSEKRDSKLQGFFSDNDFSNYFNKRDDNNTTDDFVRCSDISPPILEEIDCGEPMKDQHLWIDFTPIPGVDDDRVLYEKCAEFWAFVDSQPILQKMIVLPEPPIECQSASSSTEKIVPKLEEKVKEKGAIDFLPGLGLKGFKLAPKYCDEYPGTYDDGYYLKTKEQSGQRRQSQSTKYTKEGVLESSLMQTWEKNRNPSPRPEDVRELCCMMENFDKKHPKSMEPPGHAPAMTHALLQRCHKTLN